MLPFRMNPRAPRLNPMFTPFSGMAQSIRRHQRAISKRKSVPEVQVVLVDTREGQESWPYKILAFGTANYHEYFDTNEVPEGELCWVVGVIAAKAGYGPLIYDILARAAGSPIYKSIDLNDNSRRFWRRQGANFIAPLNDEKFRLKYGADAPPEINVDPAYWNWSRQIADISWSEEVFLDDAISTARELY